MVPILGVLLLCIDTMTMATHKGTHLIGADLQFRGLVHYHHGGMQAGLVLEKDLRVPKTAGRDPGPGLRF